MDMRNSKETLLDEIDRLTTKLDIVHEKGVEGIEYVGQANYADREQRALRKLNFAMYGCSS